MIVFKLTSWKREASTQTKETGDFKQSVKKLHVSDRVKVKGQFVLFSPWWNPKSYESQPLISKSEASEEVQFLECPLEVNSKSTRCTERFNFFILRHES